jgi:hypothetical protein
MASNTEKEMRWINAWSDLHEILRDRRDVKCQLPDFTIVDVKACLAWLQDSAYAGYVLTVSEGWIEGKRGIFVSRRMPGADEDRVPSEPR